MPIIAGWPSSLLAAYIDEIMLPKCRTPYINGRWLYAAVKVNDLRKNKVGCCFMFSCCWVFLISKYKHNYNDESCFFKCQAEN